MDNAQQKNYKVKLMYIKLITIRKRHIEMTSKSIIIYKSFFISDVTQDGRRGN